MNQPGVSSADDQTGTLFSRSYGRERLAMCALQWMDTRNRAMPDQPLWNVSPAPAQ